MVAMALFFLLSKLHCIEFISDVLYKMKLSYMPHNELISVSFASPLLMFIAKPSLFLSIFFLLLQYNDLNMLFQAYPSRGIE